MALTESFTTRRLSVSLLTEEAMRALCAENAGKTYGDAYEEIRAAAEAHPAERAWYAAWQVCAKREPDKALGYLACKGPAVNGVVELRVCIPSGRERDKTVSEAIRGMLQWAFREKDVVAAEVCADYYNDDLQEILKRSGFKRYNKHGGLVETGELLWFRTQKPNPGYMGTGFIIGVIAGAIIGKLVGMSSFLTVIGLAIGVFTGVFMDNREKRRREKLLNGEA